MSKFVEYVTVRKQLMSWGATWTMTLEKWTSASGKTAKYSIYHSGGQSYQVSEHRSLRSAMKDLNSYSMYI